MNRGLYTCPGVLVTAMAAEWAKRLEGPTTKLSKVNWGLKSMAVGFFPLAFRAFSSSSPKTRSLASELKISFRAS